jgi:signal transduction histidine kinase
LHDGLKNLFSLVDELLTWSRIQRGTMDYTPGLNSIQACFNEVMAIVSGLADKKGININYDFEDNIICNCDKNMITTVMRNLITNAIKFTPSLGTILVKGYKTKDEIVVSVIDSGIGISKDDMKKLFRLDTPFTRRGTNDEAGTGLGLLLCKEFINKHNGKIWVESEEGKGSTFSFSIPVNSEE